MNIFNRWRRVDRNEFPKKNGWYICTICYLFDAQKNLYATYVMDLYFYKESKRWIDNRKIISDHLYNRTDQVIAWKKTPKPYLDKERNYYKNESEKGKRNKAPYSLFRRWFGK